MYINIDKKGAIYALEKKVAETLQAEAVTLRALQAMETVKHHKVVNNRVVTAIKSLGGYATLSLDRYAPRIVLYFDHDKRVYKLSAPDKNECSIADYFSETQVDIYFEGGYPEMITATQKRLEGIRESRAKYQKELDDMDTIIGMVQHLHAAYKQLENHSYIIREVFGIR